MRWQQEAYKVFIIGPPSSMPLSHQDAISSETAGPGQIPVFLTLLQQWLPTAWTINWSLFSL